MAELSIGRKLAPPRFLLFIAVLALGLAVAIPPLGWARGTMAAFDVAAAAFLLAIIPLLRHGEAINIRAAAKANDANRVGLLALTGLVMVVVLVSVAAEMGARTQTGGVALIVATLAFAWLFSNTVYALHYAHLFYVGNDKGKDSGGLDFPDCPEPDYWDFIYFSFTLGMTFQTSDVAMTSRKLRRVTIGHCLTAFVFNIGVLAFTINVLGG